MCRIIRPCKEASVLSRVDHTGTAARKFAKGATMMKPSTTDKVEGKFHEVKGKVKEAAGQLTHNPGLEAEGIVEKAAGKVQGMLGRVENSFEK